MRDYILTEIKKLSTVLQLIEKDHQLLETLEKIAKRCTQALQQGNKILFAGNGGSAADSQHLAAELACRLTYDRPAIAAIALTTDTSVLTAISNDYSFESLFSRQIEAIGQSGDVFIAISTSGKSPNILKALTVARERKLVTVGLSGIQAPVMAAACDFIINVPSNETQKIQECHILIGHILCGLIQESLFT